VKVCITGGAGYIGHYCLLRLSQITQISHVVCLSRKKRPINFPISAGSVQWIEGDVMKPHSLEKAFLGCDVVVHLAGLMPFSPTVSEAEFDACNHQGTINVIEACKKMNVPKVILASTYAVYGSPRNRIEASVSEQTVPNPDSPYSRSKLKSENELCASGLSYYVLRLSHVYGVGAGIGDPGGVLVKFIGSAVKSGKIALSGDVLVSRDYIYLHDVVRVLVQAILDISPSKKKLNVSSGKPVTLYDVAKNLQKIISDLYGRKINLEIVSQTAHTERVMVIENRQLFELVGDLNLTSFEDGLKQLIRYQNP
jgi:UDP-glucose 4-epimerase